MNATVKGWVVASMELSGAVGSIIAGPLADNISRRWALVVSVVIVMLGTGLLTGARNSAMITAGRLVCGIAIGILANTAVSLSPTIAIYSALGGLTVGTGDLQPRDRASAASWHLNCVLHVLLDLG